MLSEIIAKLILRKARGKTVDYRIGAVWVGFESSLQATQQQATADVDVRFGEQLLLDCRWEVDRIGDHVCKDTKRHLFA